MQDLTLTDDIYTNFACAVSAGFVATVVGSPVDVLKTRIINMDAG